MVQVEVDCVVVLRYPIAVPGQLLVAASPVKISNISFKTPILSITFVIYLVDNSPTSHSLISPLSQL